MNVIASCLSTLCDFRILHCSYSPQLFDSFARSNAHLHIVDIEINLLRECSELSEEGICIEIVKSFEICRSLRELYVGICDAQMDEKHQTIVKALEGYRRSSTCVTLCGVRYFPS